MAEHGDDRVGGHEAMTPQRSEFADGRAVARHDERLALIEGTHDLATVGQGSSRVTVVTRSMALSNEAIEPTPALSAHATR
jgi:hypothetical protein